MSLAGRVGYLTEDQFVKDITGTGGTGLSGTFQPLNSTLTALSTRAIGAASATDILDRAAGDARYVLTGAAIVSSFNTRTGAVTLTSSDVTTALTYTPTSITGLTGVQSVAAFKTGLSLVKGDVGLGSVDNTADAAKNVLSATKLTTARTIAGKTFDGTANITIADTDLTGVAWTSWTPTWTNLTIGNAVVAAFFKQIGKTVVATIHVTFGTTTSVTGSPIQFTLPVAGKGTLGDHQGFDPGLLYDSSAGLLCAGLVQIASAGLSTATVKAQTVSGSNVIMTNSSSTVPFTWAVSDEMVFSFFYEAA